MNLIDQVIAHPGRMVVPLMGFPGTQLTHSTIWQNEFNARMQFETIAALVDRFKPDAAFFMMDLAVEAGAIGLPVVFPQNESPTVKHHPVHTIADLDQFRAIDVLYDGRVRTYISVMEQMAAALDIIKGAYVIGPFTLAGLMMGATELAIATIERRDLVHAAATLATEVIIPYGQALVAAGADTVCILEPTATFISPHAFDEFSGHYVRQIFEALDTIGILHICGDTQHLIEPMCATGAQGLSLDAPLDFPAAIAQMPEDVVLIGNLDPVRVMTNGSPAEVRAATHKLLEDMAPYPNFILSTGCDLPPETPLDNIAAFMEAGRAT